MKVTLALIAGLLLVGGCQPHPPVAQERHYSSGIEEIYFPPGTKPDLRSCVWISDAEPCARVTHKDIDFYITNPIQHPSDYPHVAMGDARELEFSDGHKQRSVVLSCVSCTVDKPIDLMVDKRRHYIFPPTPKYFQIQNSFVAEGNWELHDSEGEELYNYIISHPKCRITMKYYSFGKLRDAKRG